MLFEDHSPSGATAIGAYRDGIIEIGGSSYTCPLVVRSRGVEALTAGKPSELTAEDLLHVPDGESRPEIIIIGTGETQQFLHPKITVSLAAEGIGLECMNTASACRTIVLLQSEGRKVWAWLF